MLIKDKKIIICYGMPRSASTYIWQITMKMVHARFHQYYVKEEFDPIYQSDFVYDVGEALPQIYSRLPDNYTYVIKTHGKVSDQLIEFSKKYKLHFIFNIRNPYELIKSWEDISKNEKNKEDDEQREGFTEVETIDDIVLRVNRDVRICRAWLEAFQDQALIFRYPEIVNNDRKNVDRIAEYIDFRVKDKKELIMHFRDRSNVLEFNKGRLGRKRKLNAVKFIKEMRNFANFIDEFQL